MKENFPEFVKEIHMEVQETDRLLNKMGGKRPNRDTSDIKTPKVKDKERFLKAAREKQLSDLQGSSHKTVSCFLKRNFAGYKGLARNIQSHEKQGNTAKIALPSEDVI